MEYKGKLYGKVENGYISIINEEISIRAFAKW